MARAPRFGNTGGWSWFRGAELIERTRSNTVKGLRRAAERIGQESDQQVPLDEGTLMRSKHIKEFPREEAVVISYGGGSGTPHPVIPYAVKWHEESADFQHNRKHNYLRDPAKKVGPKAVNQELRKAMLEALK